MKNCISTWLIAGAFVSASMLNAGVVVDDTFATGTMNDNDWYYGNNTNNNNAYVTAMFTEFAPGRSLFQNGASGYIWKSFETQTASLTESVVLSFSFLDDSGDGAKIGLMNDNGNTPPTTDGSPGTALNGAYGFYLQVTATQMRVVLDPGDSTPFYGTRVIGDWVTYADYGTGLHSITATISQTESGIVVSAILDDTYTASVMSTDTKYLAVNEIMAVQNSSAIKFAIGDVVVQTVPESSTTALALGLLCAIGLGLTRMKYKQ